MVTDTVTHSSNQDKRQKQNRPRELGRETESARIRQETLAQDDHAHGRTQHKSRAGGVQPLRAGRAVFRPVASPVVYAACRFA